MFKTPSKILSFLVILFIVSSTTITTNAKAVNDVRKITKIKGDVYRFDNDYHSSMFVVTPDGIVATDPINFDAAEWLKGQFSKRFKLDTKYLVMSHYHDDHVSGGDVFLRLADRSFKIGLLEIGGPGTTLIIVFSHWHWLCAQGLAQARDDGLDLVRRRLVSRCGVIADVGVRHHQQAMADVVKDDQAVGQQEDGIGQLGVGR